MFWFGALADLKAGYVGGWSAVVFKSVAEKTVNWRTQSLRSGIIDVVLTIKVYFRVCFYFFCQV